MTCRPLTIPALLIVASASAADEFTPLFPTDGVPKGWVVTEWSDLAKPAPKDVQWTVKDGVLTGGKQRGTWLISEKEYADFVLEFEIKLTERGNSGVALRTPMKGDPAFDGMELQVADLRYNTAAKDSELTGGIYRAIAPTKQVYKPTEWNTRPDRVEGRSTEGDDQRRGGPGRRPDRSSTSRSSGTTGRTPRRSRTGRGRGTSGSST